MECTSKCMECDAESKEQPSLAKELERLHEQMKAQGQLVAKLRERLSGLLLPWAEAKRGLEVKQRVDCHYVEKVQEISGELIETTAIISRILDEAQV